MAKYIKQEMPDLNGDGSNKCYYRMQKAGNISTKQLVRHICSHAGVGLSESVIIHALDEVADEMASLIADGYTVSLEGIGTFQGTIGVKKDKEMDSIEGNETKRNAKSLRLDGIRFYADRKLVKDARMRCKLERAGVSRVNRTPYSTEQRMRMAQEYLSNPETPFMSVDDYAELTQMPKSSATKELRSFLSIPEAHIESKGRRPHLVYMLRKE